jgi:hypothetical protein
MENPMWCNPPKPEVEADLLARMAQIDPGVVGEGRPFVNFVEVWEKFIERAAQAQERILHAEYMPDVEDLETQIGEWAVKWKELSAKDSKAKIELDALNETNGKLQGSLGGLRKRAPGVALTSCFQTFIKLRGK